MGRVIFKLIFVVIGIVLWFTLQAVLALFRASSKTSLRVTQRCAQLLCFVLGIRVTVLGTRPWDENYFIVSNHLSWLDIVFLFAHFPAHFITSRMVEKTFFLGDVAKWGRCIFVNRKGRIERERELEEMAKVLQEGNDLFVFPEATSTNGEKVIPFKSGLFHAAIQNNKKVLPICINYTHMDKNNVTTKNRDTLFWYADMKFIPHLLKVLRLRRIRVQLTVFAPIWDERPNTLAKKAQRQISKHYNSICEDWEEKTSPLASGQDNLRLAFGRVHF